MPVVQYDRRGCIDRPVRFEVDGSVRAIHAVNDRRETLGDSDALEDATLRASFDEMSDDIFAALHRPQDGLVAEAIRDVPGWSRGTLVGK